MTDDQSADIEATSALMAKCECGHLVMHGWHLKYGCQFEDCSCSLGAGGALLASDWLAERERAAAEKAWREGAITALDYAERNEDGITLSLDLEAHPNPYRIPPEEDAR